MEGFLAFWTGCSRLICCNLVIVTSLMVSGARNRTKAPQTEMLRRLSKAPEG